MGGGGSRTEDVLKKVAEHVVRNDGMWAQVLYAARALAQLKAHGTYTEPGSSTTTPVDLRSREDMTKQFEQNLHLAIDQAYADDARLGAAIATVMHKEK